MSSQRIIFTTSWDDGCALDTRIARLLDTYGLKGTFYVPIQFSDVGSKFSSYTRRLSDEEIHQMAKTQEIGSHSYTHGDLLKMDSVALHREIVESKRELEKIAAVPVRMFCYPRGKVSLEIEQSIKEAGYIGARQTTKLCMTLPRDPFALGVTVQCAPFPFRKRHAHQYEWRHLLDPLKSYGTALRAEPALWTTLSSWPRFARAVFAHANQNGQEDAYFHLYGHSWEIDRCGMWGDLESFLQEIASYPSLVPMTNSEVVGLLRPNL